MKYFDLIRNRLSSLWPNWFLIMLLAIWSIYIRSNSINRDGLLYLKQAYLFSEGNWENGLDLYHWPFFSILIAIIHKLTNIDLKIVAHGIDLFLFGIAAFFYLKILRLISNEKEIIFYGGIIFLSTLLIMDDYLGMILRDHGFWAGCMAGTYFYFKSLQDNLALRNNFFWQLSFFLGGIFRLEGLVFLFVIPVFTFFIMGNNFQGKNFFKLVLNHFALLIMGLFCISFVLIILNSNIDHLFTLNGRFKEFGPRLFLFCKQLLSPLPLYTDNESLNLLLKNNHITITVSILGSLFLIKLIKGLGLLKMFLVYKHFDETPKVKCNDKFLKSIYFFIFIGLSLVFISLFNDFVLTDRYFVFIHFWIMLVLSPILLSFFKFKKNRKNKILNYSVVVLLVINMLDVVIDSSRPTLEKQAGIYLKSLQVNNGVTLINSERIAYYAGFSIQQIINSSNNISDMQDWIIFYVKDKSSLIKPLDYDIYKQFDNKNQAVVFFKKRI